MSSMPACYSLGSRPLPASCRPRLPSCRPAVVTVPSPVPRKHRRLSVFRALLADMAFDVPPTALMHPVPLAGERWKIGEGRDMVTLQFEVPGLNKDKLEITVDEDVLVVKTKTESKKAMGGHGVRPFQVHLLMTGYDKDSVMAKLEAGILELTIPKKAGLKSKPVDVNAVKAAALSLADLEKKTSNFESQSPIYGGSYVFRWNGDRKAAAKKLEASVHTAEFLKHVLTVSRLEHENLVELLCYCMEGDDRILAYEFPTEGSLHDVLHGKDKGPQSVLEDWKQRVRIATEAANGLKYLHDQKVVHGDIRLNNVLLFDDFKAKIGDFNILKHYPDVGYRAPEHDGAETDKLTEKSDVYSFGVVLLELLTGREPIDETKTEEKILVKWATPILSRDKVKECIDSSLKGTSPEHVAKFAEVAAKCVKENAEERPNMSEVVEELTAA